MKSLLPVIFLALLSSPAMAEEQVDFTIAVPLISLTSESAGRIELNLGMRAALAIEASYIHEHDRIHEDVTEETGETMYVNSGRSASMHIARFSQPNRLAGFYWSLGAGFQTVDVAWTVPADEEDPEIDFALLPDDGMMNHRAILSGVTGHGRVGYRYVADDYPFMAGIYLGFRHFQSGVEDYHEAKEEEADEGVSNLTDYEKERLKRKFKTAFTPSLTMGFAF